MVALAIIFLSGRGLLSAIRVPYIAQWLNLPWVSEIAPMVRITPDQPTRGAACAGSPVRTAAFDVISCRQGWGPLAG